MPRLSGCVLAKCVAMQCIAAMQCVAIATCCIAMQRVGPYVTGDNRLETLQMENSAVSMERSIFHTVGSFTLA